MPALLSALPGGDPGPRWCCSDEAAPPSEPEQAEPRSGSQQIFRDQCGRCHDTEDSSPPNFLHGTPAQVQAKLIQCAERIRFRVQMWARPENERTRSPMPPPSSLAGAGLSLSDWPAHPVFQRLLGEANALVEQSGSRGQLMRPCLRPEAP